VLEKAIKLILILKFITYVLSISALRYNSCSLYIFGSFILETKLWNVLIVDHILTNVDRWEVVEKVVEEGERIRRNLKVA